MEIKDRLRMIMESHKMNAGSFADKIGVQRSNVSHVLSGRNKPSFDFIEKLLHAFPRVSAEWLFTGKQVQGENENPKQIFNRFGLDENEGVGLKSEPVIASSASSNVKEGLSDKSGKKIVKTLVFYEDFTFDVFLPNER